MTLRKRIIHSGAWVMSGHVFSQVLRLGSNLIMTRLLVPEMFGVMAIANVIMLGLSLMSDIGIHQHIIQSKRSDSEKFLNTAWVVKIIKGIILWIISLIVSWFLFLLAGYNILPAESVYSHPMLPYIIAVLSFTTVINGLASTKLGLANRNLAMAQVVKIELVSQFTGMVLMISWALIDRSIWALVSGALVSSLIKSILSHVALPGHNNKFYWDRESFYELFHFGKWIFLTSTLGFLMTNGDKLVLGGLLDTKLMGVYVIAFFMASAIQQVFGRIISRVALPAFSEVVRTRPDDLIKVYYKFRLPIDAIILFSVGVLFMAGHHIIDILYDERYQYAGDMLEILVLMLIAERFSLAGECFIALGRPKYLIPLIVPRLPIIYILLPVIYGYFGLEGALWVIAFNNTASLPILFWLKHKHGILDTKKELLVMIFLALGIAMGWFFNVALNYIS